MVLYSVIPNKDTLYDSHLCHNALETKNKLKQLGIITNYKITANYINKAVFTDIVSCYLSKHRFI
ncbi:hypothetical protein RCA_01205 [Rickettsia canadensis str. CA410]|uniref:Uncharacterized protein n=1 Tax=Rickettsia canadensis str. CA410 TaxID=1105107 RepID=A0ABN4AGJ1_RICCA|nr:hypothetical protein RCA_01205 [Rickettsia canadensis str. CA410]